MSFLAAPFLLGVLLVGVPLWLHRMHRDAPERGFSSLFLMRAAREPVRTDRSLRHLVLLAVRCAVLAAAALAFARPALSALGSGYGSAADGAAERGRPRLVVLDRSLSMSRPEVWRRAVDRVDELTDGGAVLVAAGAELELLDSAGAAAPGVARLDFDGLMARLAALAGTLPWAERGFEVHVVSDFQATAVPARFNALIEGADWPLVLHEVGRDEDNWSVESAVLAAGEVVARVGSFAATRREIPVVLRAEGTELDRLVLETAAGARAEARFPLPEAVAVESGDTGITVSLDVEDALAADNVRRTVHRGPRSAPLALVAPAGSGPDYLAAAVEAAGLPFAVTRMTANAPAAEWPAGAALAVLVDPGALSGPLARRVSRVLENGGGVLVSVGPRTERAGALPLLEHGLQRHEPSDPGGSSVVIEDPGHPAAADWWREVRVARSVVPREAAGGRTILALEDGRSLLVEHRFGTGRLLVLHTALDREWTSLVVRPAFVRFVADALGYLGNDLGALRAVAGEPVQLPVASVQLFDADGARVLELGSTANRPTVRFPAAGFYSVRTPGRRALLAVNVDPRESDLRPAEPAVLARWRETARSQEPRTVRDPAAIAAQAEEPSDWPLAPWLLGLLAVLLLAEPVVANLGGVFGDVPGGSRTVAHRG